MSRSVIVVRAAAFTAAAVFLAGCASGPSTSSKQIVNGYLAAEKYDAAVQYLEGVKESQYGRKNAVLYYLDKATVLHHAGRYKDSDKTFDQAEKRAEELYTKSVTQAAGLLVLNDATTEYAGEPFERALLNVFRCLNYVFLGQPEEALVESRKVEVFLDMLGRKLDGKLVYRDDAFARYLDSLLYADAGQADDSRISLDAAKTAYSWYESLYHMPSPRFDFPGDSPDKGELVFVHYNGVAPHKVSKTWQIAWGEALVMAQSSQDTEAKGANFQNALRAGVGGHAITVSYPDYVQDPYRIVSSEVEVDGGQARASSLLMEDVSAIAQHDLQDRMALIKTRSVARATVKFVLAESLARAAAAQCDKQYGAGTFGAITCRGLSRGLAHGTAAATERADTRGWAAIPAQIRMARLKLPPGKHDVLIRYKDASGNVVSTFAFKDVMISKSKRTYINHRTAI